MSHLPIPDPKYTALQQTAYQLVSCTDELFQQIQQQQALTSVVDRIRSSLKLDDIFNTTATEIRQLLNADRVGVFRFIPGSRCDEGEFVAEDVAAEFPSAMANRVNDHCFGSQYATYYTQGRVQAVADIYNAGLSDCHIQVLEQFQVRANLIIPVLKNQELWGLLCVHQCSHPRRWQLAEIEFVRQIATYFAVALQQAEQMEQIKSQAALVAQLKAQEIALARQKALVKISNQIRQPLEFTDICQTAVKEVRQLLDADRVTIYRFNPDWSGDFLFESVASGWKPLVGQVPNMKDTYLMHTQGGRYADNETFAVADINTVEHTDCHIQFLEEFQAKAYAIAPIFEGEQLWGLLSAFQNSGPRQWQADEIELLAQIGEQLGIGLKQAEYVRLIQNQTMAGLWKLVAGIAHEINNPVSFIHGNLAYLDECISNLMDFADFYQQVDTQSPQDIAALQTKLEEIEIDFMVEDLSKAINSMQLGTTRIRDIVLSLRNFSRLDEADFKTVNLHEGIDSTLMILSHEIKFCGNQTGIEIVKNYGDIPLIECFPAELNQVFLNLFTNAIDGMESAINAGKFNKKNSSHHQTPQISISTAVYQQDQIEMKVRDNGIGIDEKHKDKIFDHFFTTKPAGKGKGLGLAMARQIIIEKHQGELCFNSDLDQGAEFIIRLPIKLKTAQSKNIQSC